MYIARPARKLHAANLPAAFRRCRACIASAGGGARRRCALRPRAAAPSNTLRRSASGWAWFWRGRTKCNARSRAPTSCCRCAVRYSTVQYSYSAVQCNAAQLWYLLYWRSVNNFQAPAWRSEWRELATAVGYSDRCLRRPCCNSSQLLVLRPPLKLCRILCVQAIDHEAFTFDNGTAGFVTANGEHGCDGNGSVSLAFIDRSYHLFQQSGRAPCHCFLAAIRLVRFDSAMS